MEGGNKGGKVLFIYTYYVYVKRIRLGWTFNYGAMRLIKTPTLNPNLIGKKTLIIYTYMYKLYL